MKINDIRSGTPGDALQSTREDPSDVLWTRSDAGNAALLAHTQGDELIWVGGRGWMEYDGQRWVECDEARMTERAIGVTRRLRDAGRENGHAELLDWAIDSQHSARLSAMVRVASAYLSVE